MISVSRSTASPCLRRDRWNGPRCRLLQGQKTTQVLDLYDLPFNNPRRRARSCRATESHHFRNSDMHLALDRPFPGGRRQALLPVMLLLTSPALPGVGEKVTVVEE